MKGIVLINGYPNGEKFIRQGERIAAALRAEGAEVRLVRNGEAYARLEKNGGARVFGADGATFAVYLDKDKYLGRMLENAGLRLFNSAAAVEACDDKFSTYLALSGSGIRIPECISAPLCYTPNALPQSAFLRAVADKLGFPLVAKRSYGSFGEGVRLVRDMAELQKIEGEWLHVPHFYQRYVSESCGRDIRVVVIGGKAAAAMERRAAQGEFRSNIELGGTGNAISLSPSFADVAERAARRLGLDYCGVDLLESAEGALLCEVNSNAFFEGVEQATGTDIAAAYARYMSKCLREGK